MPPPPPPPLLQSSTVSRCRARVLHRPLQCTHRAAAILFETANIVHVDPDTTVDGTVRVYQKKLCPSQ